MANSNSNKLNDFKELLAQSQRLASQMGEYDESKSIYKGISELSEASKLLAKSGNIEGRGSDSKFEQSAFRLLAQRTFDAEGLSREVKAIQLKSHYDPMEKLDSTDIDGYLAHHQDMIVLTALDEAKRISEDDIQDLQRRWAAEEWSKSRKHFLESLGLRSQRWSSDSSIRTLTVRPIENSAGSKPFLSPLLTPKKALQNLSNSGSQNSSSIGVAKQIMSGSDAAIAPVVLSGHEAVVRKLLQASCGQSSLYKPLVDLSNTLATGESVSSNFIIKDLAGFRNCLDLLGCMVGENSAEGNTTKSSGYFLPTCLPDRDSSHESLLGRRRLMAKGSKYFLERQFETLAWHKVDQAVRQGQLTIPMAGEGGTRLARLKAFAILVRRNNINLANCIMIDMDNSSNGVPLWLLLYLCLRCGALHEAKVVLHAAWNKGLIGEMGTHCVSVLEAVFKCTNSSENKTSDSSSNNLPHGTVICESMLACRTFFYLDHNSSTVTTERNHHALDNASDPYFIVCLNLFGLADLDALASVGQGGAGVMTPGGTLEDFLWGGLWFAETCEDIRKLPMGAVGGSDSSSYGDRGFGYSGALTVFPRSEILCPTFTIEDIYIRVERAGGEAYFARAQSSSSKYCMVLLCLQKVGAAVSFLWRGGHSVEALHLLVISLYYGLVLPHTPLDTASVRGGAPPPAPIDILRVWARHSLGGCHPSVLADYLLIAGSLSRVEAETCRGIPPDLLERCRLAAAQTQEQLLKDLLCFLNRDQVSTLVGDVTTNGTRSGGYMDSCLTRDQIDSLLVHAGRVLLDKGGPEVEGGLHLLMLGGSYVDVLNELNRRLAMNMLPETTTSTPEHEGFRAFWLAACKGFYERHIQNSSIISNKLEESGYSSLIHTYRVLISLSTFFELTSKLQAPSSSHLKEGLRILDQLQILPNDSVSDLPSAQENFLSLPSPLLMIMDFVMIRSMEVIVVLYGVTRSEGISGAFRNERMEALRRRASLLVSLAGLVKGRLQRTDTVARLARMEVMMA